MCILFDLDGVFYEGDKPIDGGHEVISWVQQNKIRHLFITNTTSRPRQALLEKLERFNIYTDKSHIITPAVAAAHWLRENDYRNIALYIPEVTHCEFSDFNICMNTTDNIDAVIIGDLGESWDFKTLNRAFQQLMNKQAPQLLALGMTRYWKSSIGLQLDVAPFVVALEHAADTKALVLGKPAVSFYETAIQMLSCPKEEIFMIGDDINGDIAGSQNAGAKGVLVKTGKFRPKDLNRGIKPVAVLDSIKAFPEWWNRSKLIC